MGGEIRVQATGQGIQLAVGENTYFLDNRSAHEGNHNLVSHAHFDHLPSRFTTAKLICSKETARLIKLRKNKAIKPITHASVKQYAAGHVLGAKMFLIEGKVLYTGDFNTEKKYCGYAKPVHCDTLIMDSTFGNPKYHFPAYDDIVGQLKEYLEAHPKVLINAYSFGKAQEVCHLLNSFRIPFSVTDPIKKVNDALGLTYAWMDAQNTDVIVQHHNDPKQGYQKIALSGWASEPFYNHAMQLDASFPLSDHADYPHLLEFVRKCKPNRVFTAFGHNVDLAVGIRKELGIDAEPLIKNQNTLSRFF